MLSKTGMVSTFPDRYISEVYKTVGGHDYKDAAVALQVAEYTVFRASSAQAVSQELTPTWRTLCEVPAGLPDLHKLRFLGSSKDRLINNSHRTD